MEEGICAEDGIYFLGVEHTPSVVGEVQDTGAVFVMDVYYVALEVGFVEIVCWSSTFLIICECKGCSVFVVDVVCYVGNIICGCDDLACNLATVEDVLRCYAVS